MKKFLLFLLLFVATERFCHWQTGGFQAYKIVSTPSSFMAPPSEEVSQILDQPFYFLGSGAQFYAFESDDGQTVIKFLKRRKSHAPAIRKSAATATAFLKEETGLIYAQAHHFSKMLILHDKLGIVHTIDLNLCEFFLQQKAEPYRVQKESIDAMIDLVFSQCSKGVVNLDPMIERNFGLVRGRAIVVDLGSFTTNRRLKTPQGIKSELFLELLPLRTLLKEKHPELLDYFDEKIKAHL